MCFCFLPYISYSFLNLVLFIVQMQPMALPRRASERLSFQNFLNRAAEQEIPAAQHARYRHFVLKRRNKTCSSAVAVKKQAAKKHKLEQRAKDEAATRNEAPKLEELGGPLDEDDLS